MKPLLFSFFISITISVFGQNYLPLNTPKRFQNSISAVDNDYYFYPIDTLTNASIVTYVQYLKIGTSTISLPSTACGNVWGDPNFVDAADTTWLGRYISFNTATNKLLAVNKPGEDLTFDFSLAMGDSATFYQNATDEYYLKYDQINEEVIYGVMDSVKSYSILKYDLLGSPSASALNNFQVKLGKNLGLLSLIDCNNFPSIETGVDLMGQLYPTIGTYNMTYDELYPWTPGDSLEVRGSQQFFTTYKLITVVDRVETVDSVWIHLSFEGDLTGFNIQYPDVIVYGKGDNISTIPNNSFWEGYQIYNDSGSLCGTRKRHHIAHIAKYYCESYHCFPDFDAFGSFFYTDTYLAGLGKTFRKSESFGSGNMATGTLIYSNIGGVTCGTPVALGTKELDLKLAISPNPVKNEVNVHTSFEIISIEVVNSAGVVQLQLPSNGFSDLIDVSGLDRGVYFIRIKASDGNQVSSKFVKF
ncbi:MAG: T9SS type A sorting domain-containing protein [Crocinitomicaceae bacterium]|nr:T9SS type A sorting domain-containing protein [Flavobacteriales bacterium]NQZ37795.1 T9SS type A sorting domain-containing protein [Crocinitomicaceae bacterium]